QLRAAGRVPARAGVAAPGRVPRRRPPSLTGAGAASGLLGACVGAGRLLEPVDRLVDGREPRLGEAQLAREERDLAAQLVGAPVARGDVADERDDQRVEQEVGAT